MTEHMKEYRYYGYEELVYKMYARKQSTYFVNKVYPKLGLKFWILMLFARPKEWLYQEQKIIRGRI